MWIHLNGCDVATHLDVGELTPEQLALIDTLAIASQLVGGGCSPTMTIDSVSPFEHDESHVNHSSWTKAAEVKL